MRDTPVYEFNGAMMTARDIAKALNQPHTQTRKLLYAGLPPKIVPKPFRELKLKNWKVAMVDE